MFVDHDLCLPSLDELLTDNNASDPDGLFSGFQTLSNKDLDMFPSAEDGATQSIQQSNTILGSASEGHSPSDGSDGEMSQANGSTRAPRSADTQALPEQAKLSHTPGSILPTSSVPTQAASPQTEPGTFPSLAGMTAAEVAHAVGYSTAKQPPPVVPGTNSSPITTAPAPTKKQANGKKKRGRETEAAGTSNGASEQHAVPAGVMDTTSRAGSPGFSSSSDVSPAELQQEPSSSGPAAPDGEEQKRMVCHCLIASWSLSPCTGHTCQVHHVEYWFVHESLASVSLAICPTAVLDV